MPVEGRDLTYRRVFAKWTARRLVMSLVPPSTVEKLQAALHTKAKETPTYRFYALYDKLYRWDVLTYAYERCRANGGAAGVDGQTFADIEEYGAGKWHENGKGRRIDRGRCGGCGYRKRTASSVRWGYRCSLHTASPYNEVWDFSRESSRRPASSTNKWRGGFQHSRAPSLRRAVVPALPGWLAQLGDDLGRQPHPPQAMRNALDAVQFP